MEHHQSELQKNYSRALEFAWRSGVNKIRSWRSFFGKKQIQININDISIESDVNRLLKKELKSFSVEIYNNETIDQNRNLVYQKFKKELEENKISSNFGGPSADGFFAVSDFVIAVLFNWSIIHIFDDIDDKAWGLVKENLLKIYKLLAKSKKDKKELVIRTASKIIERALPTIIFIFPGELTGEEFKNELNNIFIITQKVITQKESVSVYKYTYDVNTKSWVVVKIPPLNI
jgi:hypothetical protein